MTVLFFIADNYSLRFDRGFVPIVVVSSLKQQSADQ